jgi:hypothetical protein
LPAAESDIQRAVERSAGLAGGEDNQRDNVGDNGPGLEVSPLEIMSLQTSGQPSAGSSNTDSTPDNADDQNRSSVRISMVLCLFPQPADREFPEPSCFKTQPRIFVGYWKGHRSPDTGLYEPRLDAEDNDNLKLWKVVATLAPDDRGTGQASVDFWIDRYESGEVTSWPNFEETRVGANSPKLRPDCLPPDFQVESHEIAWTDAFLGYQMSVQLAKDETVSLVEKAVQQLAQGATRV